LFSFALVYPDKTGKHIMRKVGTVRGDGGVSAADAAEALGGKDAADVGMKTLKELKLEVGDYIDVAIMSPMQGGGAG